MSGVVTFGETMALLSARAVGPLRHAASLDLGCAGSESNVAIGAARLGCATTWMGRVGADELGGLVLTRLRGEGVDVRAATVDDEAPTGLMIKERRTAEATRVIYYRRGSAGSRLRPEHLDETAIREAAVLHVTGITCALSASARDAVAGAAEVAAEAGTPVSFDPNFRAQLTSGDEAARVWRDLLPRVDLVFATADEAQMLADADEEDPARLADLLADRGVEHAVVKRGAEGAVARITGDAHVVEPVPVEAVDPVGAGDGFVAGYLTGLVEGREPAERLRLAALLGAFAVSAHGDWEGLPHRHELGLLGDRADDVSR